MLILDSGGEGDQDHMFGYIFHSSPAETYNLFVVNVPFFAKEWPKALGRNIFYFSSPALKIFVFPLFYIYVISPILLFLSSFLFFFLQLFTSSPFANGNIILGQPIILG